MKKKHIVWITALLSLVAIVGIAAAQMSAKWKNSTGQIDGMGMRGIGMHGSGMMMHHDAMEKVMEEGTYSDLVKLREQVGFKMMPWVENEEDFKLVQQMHEKMEKFHEENGMKTGCPMMG